MKLIYKIAVAELRSLFYSPIAWFLTIAFLVQCSLAFTDTLHNIAATQEMGGMAAKYMSRLTSSLFTNSYSGLFGSAMQNLYLYIPMLTMGVISREVIGETTSLLYSSPVKVKEIVFGKYLAMMIYNLLLLLVIVLFIITGVLTIQHPDTGTLWSASLGFYLILCSYAAIGMFMSCLTSYQVVAAIGTFIIIGILTYIGELWQGIDFVRDLTYFLSLRGRTQQLLYGLITTKDILYFMVIVYLFVGFTVYKMQGDRESKPFLVKLSRYVVIIVSALLIGYISSRPAFTGYLDVSANKDNTLTPNAQKIIKEMGDSTLEIILYCNVLDDKKYYGLPQARNNFLRVWEPYVRFKPDIRFCYVYYYDEPYGNGYSLLKAYPGKTLKEIVEQQLKGIDIDMSKLKTPAEIKRLIDLRPEQNRFVMQLKYKGRTTFLRVFNDQETLPSEREVSAAFKRLLQSQMPKIIFATAEGERSGVGKGARGYNALIEQKGFRYALINQGFDVDTVSLNTQPIPDSVTTLVVADPLRAFTAIAREKIQQYINHGGNILIAGEPGRQHLINPLLKPLGVQLMNGMLKQKIGDQPRALVMPMMSDKAKELSTDVTPPNTDTLWVSNFGAAGLRYSDTLGFTAMPLLQTINGRASNTASINPDAELADGDNVVSTAIPEQADVYTTAVGLTRQINGRQQRIVVLGDADLLSNSELGRQGPEAFNFYFATSLFSWMDYGTFPINTSRPKSKDNSANLSIAQVDTIRLFYVWVLPGVLLLAGSVLLIRRKRK